MQLNNQYSEAYRSYNPDLPIFLINRPRDFVTHVCQRWTSADLFTSHHINQVDEKTWEVTSIDSEKIYSVHFGNNRNMPYCGCYDWERFHWPCKHFCAVFRNSNYGWDKLCSFYRDSPYFKLDSDVVSLSLSVPTVPDNSDEISFQKLLIPISTNTVEHIDNVDSMDLRASDCRRLLKNILDLTYLCTSMEHFDDLWSTLHTAQASFTQGIPHTNGLALNNTSSLMYTVKRSARSVKSKQKQSRLKDPLLHLLRKKKPKRSCLKRQRQCQMETIVSELTSVSDTNKKPARAPVSDTNKKPARAPVSDTNKKPARAPVGDTNKKPARAPVGDTNKKPARAPVGDTNKKPVPVSDTNKKPAPAPVSDTNKKTKSKQSHLEDPLLHLVRKNKPKRSRLRTRQRKMKNIVAALISADPRNIPAPVGYTNLKPAPVGDTNKKPAPAGDTDSKPAPVGDTNKKPAPAGDTNLKPAPAPVSDTNKKPAPVSDTNLNPAPVGDTNTNPAPNGDTNLKPAPAVDTNKKPAPAPVSDTNKKTALAPVSDTNKKPAPVSDTNLNPAPISDTNTNPAPAGDTNLKPAPVGDTNTKPAPAGDTNLKPAPAPVSDTNKKPSSSSQ